MGLEFRGMVSRKSVIQGSQMAPLPAMAHMKTESFNKLEVEGAGFELKRACASWIGAGEATDG